MYWVDFISWGYPYYLHLSFVLYEKSGLFIFFIIILISILLANYFQKIAILIILSSVLSPFLYFFYFERVILNGYFDQEAKNENFHYGCMTYYTTVQYQPKNAKEVSYSDYFIIDHSFVKVHIRRKNSPIAKQVHDFNILLNPNKCYKIRYMEYKFLFYRKIEVYDLIENPESSVIIATNDRTKP